MRLHPGRVALVVAALLAPGVAHGQLFARRVEVFGTAGGIGGATPVRIDGRSYIGAHGGLRVDAGIQGGRFAFAVGTRFWELVPTRNIGGQGFDGFFSGEWRVGPDSRTNVRASLGVGFNEIDGGSGPERGRTGISGVLWSIGAARELIAPSGALVIVSADFIVPTVNTGVNGRRLPVVELGVGFRLRASTSIAPRPSSTRPH